MRKAIIDGLIIHTGYVENSKAGILILSHIGSPRYTSLQEALTGLVYYLYENYIECTVEHDRSLDDFVLYLESMPDHVASGMGRGFGNTSWDPAHPNCEQWWPWDTVTKIYPNLHHYYECVHGSTERDLVWFLDHKRLNPYDPTKADLIDMHADGDHWRRPRDIKGYPIVHDKDVQQDLLKGWKKVAQSPRRR